MLKVFKTKHLDLPIGNQFTEEWFRDELREIIEQESIGVVVIDPWTNVAPDLNHKEFNKAIEQILSCMPEDEEKCPAIVVIAHLRKPSGQGKRKQVVELMQDILLLLMEFQVMLEIQFR